MENYLSLMRVLYVEDEEDIREELEEFLEFRVAELYVANNGQEGVKAFKEHKPDIVISDIKMPIMDGLEMSKEIKNIDRETPIVITTAFSDTSYLMKAIETGVDKYVTKPIQVDLLLTALNDVAKIIYQSKELVKKQQEILEFKSRQAQMGEMISAVAHQWKQPLNIIAISVTNFSLDYELNDEITKEGVYDLETNIRKQIDFMSNTLDEFRNFFKTSKERVEFSIKNSIKNVLSLIDAQYKTQNIKIDLNGDEDIKISGYPNEFEQVVINIFNNARDAMLEKNIENKKIAVDIFKENNKGVVTIIDNAGGIPEEIIDRIFEPYVSTKSDEKGTGIGLYMSKSIIDKIGGKILVENIENGAKFKIELKLMESEK